MKWMIILLLILVPFSLAIELGDLEDICHKGQILQVDSHKEWNCGTQPLTSYSNVTITGNWNFTGNVSIPGNISSTLNVNNSQYLNGHPDTYFVSTELDSIFAAWLATANSDGYYMNTIHTDVITSYDEMSTLVNYAGGIWTLAADLSLSSGYTESDPKYSSNPNGYYNVTTLPPSTGGSTNFTKDIIITEPYGANNASVIRAAFNMTINAMHILCIDGTNITGMIDRYDSNGLNRVIINADVTALNNTVYDLTFSPGIQINQSQYIGWHTTATNGDITRAIVTIDYTSR